MQTRRTAIAYMRNILQLNNSEDTESKGPDLPAGTVWADAVPQMGPCIGSFSRVLTKSGVLMKIEKDIVQLEDCESASRKFVSHVWVEERVCEDNRMKGLSRALETWKISTSKTRLKSRQRCLEPLSYI